MIEAEVPLNDDGTAFLPFSIRMLLQYNILDKLEQIQTVWREEEDDLCVNMSVNPYTT